MRCNNSRQRRYADWVECDCATSLLILRFSPTQVRINMINLICGILKMSPNHIDRNKFELNNQRVGSETTAAPRTLDVVTAKTGTTSRMQ